jgi:hypothetical protein
MKRIFLTAIAFSALVVSAPSVASASHHGRSCHRAHHSKHSSCASRARRLRFGAPLTAGAPTGTVPSSPSVTGTTDAPGSPTTPAPGGETAGTVKSFTEGVLVITLNDHSTVSGKVNEQTQIHCLSASSSGSDDGSDEGDQTGGERGSGADGGSSSPGPDAHAASTGSGDEGDGSSDGAGQEAGSGEDQEGASGTCSTAALVPGAVVREAELSVSGSGAVWDHIELLQ